MNIEPCPKCGTNIDLHYIQPAHDAPDGGLCEFPSTPEFWDWAEDFETCSRCGDREREGPGGALEYIGDGYSAHVACLRPETGGTPSC